MPGDELERRRQLVCCLTEGFSSELLSDGSASYLEDNSAGRNACRPELKRSFTLSHARLVTLDANGDVGENPEVHLRAFDDFYVSFDDLLSGHELFCGKPDAHSFDSDAPVAERECGSPGRAACWDWNTTFVSFDILDLAWGEL